MLETIENFIAMVEANKHVEAVERFYAVNATLQDNQSTETRGKDKQIENEKNLLLTIKKMHSKCAHPYFVKDNNVVIKWQFRFEFKTIYLLILKKLPTNNGITDKLKKNNFFSTRNNFYT